MSSTVPSLAQKCMQQKIGKVFTIILTLTIFGWAVAGSRAAQATEYYVSPNGSNSNDGTFDHPWKTVEYALGQLSPGDVLYLRAGIYYEHEISTSLNGMASAPITIQSYPGERALIDGGVPYFKDAPNSEWELVDGSINLYQSTRTFSSSFVRAWLVDDDVQLVEYETEENLESTNYGPLNGWEPFYMGPGLQLRNDGHIYIRLEYNPNDLTDPSGDPIDPTPIDTNPNHNRIAVFTSNHVFLLDGASYLHFKDLDFSYSDYIMDVRNGSHHVELDGCSLNYGRYGLVIRDGIHDWEIHDCEFNNGLPDYVYWTDVKNRGQEVAEAYPEFQSGAVGGSMPGFNIHHNVFRNTFDALNVEDGSSDASITENVFKYTRDDAINLYRGISNVKVAHNMFWHVATGISILGSNEAPGHVYIHHNVIDNSAYQRGGRPGNYREDEWPVWIIIDPFGSHDSGNKASWWKLYNNTIVTRRSYQWGAAGPTWVTGNSEKYVYNNIFYVMDDRIVYRGDLAASGSHYDGNVVYQNAPGNLPLFLDFGDGDSYYSLDEFREDSGTDWEINGLEVDPGFSIPVIDDPLFDSATIWERYRPHNCQVCTAGASYSGLNWPGTEDLNYRGAIPPLRIFLPIIFNDSPTVLGQATTLTATVTAGSNVVYAFAFGDGSPLLTLCGVSGDGVVVTHTYPAVGTYTAVVTASNSVNVVTASTTVTIEETLGGLSAVNDSPTVLGQATMLTATVAAGSNVAYTWAFGDGSPLLTTGGVSGDGVVVTHTYPAVGVYTVVVTASNSVSVITATTTVTIEETLGGLSAVNDSPTVLGQGTMLTATVAAGSNVAYTWAFSNGSPLLTTGGASGGEVVVTHTYPAVGTYTAVVTASNSVSVVTATTTVTIEETIGGLSAVNDSPTVLGQATTLTATVTAGSNVVYAFAFGDGSPLLTLGGASEGGVVVTHTYPAVGTYTAVVPASNSVSVVTATTTVAIEETLGGLSAVNDSPTVLGQATTLTATVTAGSNVVYAWAFGDGSPLLTLGGASEGGVVVTHTYPAVGTYTAVVPASNSVSVVTATTTVAIEETIGGLSAVNDSPTVLGQATTLTATVTAGSNVAYTWAFGDGSPLLTIGGASEGGVVVTHTYPAVGTYTAVVTASNSVSVVTATTTVTIEETIGSLSAVNDSPTVLGQATALTATVTAGSNVAYTWAFGNGSPLLTTDGASGGGVVVTHTYPAVGTYMAVVTVSNSVSVLATTTTVTVASDTEWTLHLPFIASFAHFGRSVVQNMGVTSRRCCQPRSLKGRTTNAFSGYIKRAN